MGAEAKKNAKQPKKKPIKKSSPAKSKVVKKPAKRPSKTQKPTSAHLHNAPPLGLKESDLNPKEKKVLTFMRRSKLPKTLGELADELFPGTRPQARANSQVRNSIRRLVREKFIRKVSDARKGDEVSSYIAKKAKK